MQLPERLETKRLNLCRIRKSFKEAELFTAQVLDNIRELSLWLDWAHQGYCVEEAYEYLLFCEKSWADGTLLSYRINNKAGEFMGVISVKNDDKNRQSMFGYWLSTRQNGHGYMQEAVRRLEEELFKQDVNKIIIRTDVRNFKSARVAQSFGYRLDGIMRQEMYVNADGSYRDINIFSKLKDEYK